MAGTSGNGRQWLPVVSLLITLALAGGAIVYGYGQLGERVAALQRDVNEIKPTG